MIEVYYETYSTCMEQDIHSEREQYTLPFNCIQDAIAWSSFYHRNCLTYTDPSGVFEVDYGIKGIWDNGTKVAFTLPDACTLTQEQADALPSGFSDCVG